MKEKMAYTTSFGQEGGPFAYFDFQEEGTLAFVLALRKVIHHVLNSQRAD